MAAAPRAASSSASSSRLRRAAHRGAAGDRVGYIMPAGARANGIGAAKP
jgi:hypothetical protein